MLQELSFWMVFSQRKGFDFRWKTDFYYLVTWEKNRHKHLKSIEHGLRTPYYSQNTNTFFFIAGMMSSSGKNSSGFCERPFKVELWKSCSLTLVAFCKECLLGIDMNQESGGSQCLTNHAEIFSLPKLFMAHRLWGTPHGSCGGFLQWALKAFHRGEPSWLSWGGQEGKVLLNRLASNDESQFRESFCSLPQHSSVVSEGQT